MMTLYDEEEVMKRYVESERNEAVICNTIEMCQDFGVSVAETIQKLVHKFALSRSAAESKVQKYWR